MFTDTAGESTAMESHMCIKQLEEQVAKVVRDYSGSFIGLACNLCHPPENCTASLPGYLALTFACGPASVQFFFFPK